MEHRMDKAALLERIRANRESHRALFEEAATGYREQCISLLDQHIQRLKQGKVERVSITLPVPEDHTADYDAVIDMLEMAVDDTVVMDEQDFRMYVRDEWVWKGQFLATASNYTGDNRRRR